MRRPSTIIMAQKFEFEETRDDVASRSCYEPHGVNIPSDIKAFHENFGLTYDGPPRLLSEDLQRFRSAFMREELAEYDLAVASGNMPMALDALVDLVYVAVGTAYMHGFPFAEAWRRVQEANMKKIRCERPSDSQRGSTYDVIKPEGWVAPDHSDLVEVVD